MVILRIVVGASFIMHGAPKLAHPMSWDGPTGPLPGVPAILQLIICIAENVGGWCIIVGLFTPLFAFLLSCDMFERRIHRENVATDFRTSRRDQRMRSRRICSPVHLVLLLGGPDSTRSTQRSNRFCNGGARLRPKSVTGA